MFKDKIVKFVHEMTNSKWLFISVLGVFVMISSVVIPGIVYVFGAEIHIGFIAIGFPVGAVMMGICGNEYYLESGK